MKNNLDKIFIILAFIVLGASCAIYFLGGASMDEFSAQSKALAKTTGTGNVYNKVEVKGVERVSVDAWALPKAQDTEGKLTFQLFTPPAIWKTKDTGALLTSLPKRVIDVKVEEKKVEEKQYAVCEVELRGFSNTTYPIRLTGYIGDPADPTFEFKDTQKNIEFSGKRGEVLKYKDPEDISGQTYIDLGLKVLAFKRDNVKDADGIVSTIMMVSLEDASIPNRKIALRTDRATTLPELRKMKLEASDGTEFLLSKKGESFEYNGSKYTVTDISFEKRYIDLKQVPADSKIIPQNFSLNIANPKAKKSARAQNQANKSAQADAKTKAEAKPKELAKPKVEEKPKPVVDINAKKRAEEVARQAAINAEKAREEELKEARRLGIEE